MQVHRTLLLLLLVLANADGQRVARNEQQTSELASAVSGMIDKFTTSSFPNRALKVRDRLLRRASMRNSAVNMHADGRRTVYIYINTYSYIHIYIRAECARTVLLASDALATDVYYFFESMSTSTVDIDRKSIFLVLL